MKNVRELTGKLLPSGMRRTKCFVRAQCGEDNPAKQETGPDFKGGDAPEWTETAADKAKMFCPRWGGDEGVLVLAVYLTNKKGNHTFLGGNHLQVNKYMSNPDVEYEEEVSVYVSGNATGGAGSGALNVNIKWAADPNARGRSNPPMGNLEVTIISGSGLKKPTKIIRDLSTYVDYTAAYIAAFLFISYLVAGFTFYQGFMAAPLELLATGVDQAEDAVLEERQVKLLEKIQGGNGGWTALNTLVFMVTSFTTVGYGNQPSMIATSPPCEYAGGPQILSDAPFSLIIPDAMRGSKVGIGKMLGSSEGEVEQSFVPLDAKCFPTTVSENGVGDDPDCRVIADDTKIFDFSTRQLYMKDDVSPPRNFTTDLELSMLALQPMPGDTGFYDCGDVNDDRANETHQECYLRFVATCESSLHVWRSAESKKDISKVFTAVFAMIGIGILGAVVGVFGETLMDWAKNLFEVAEASLDIVVAPATAVTGMKTEDLTGDDGKGVCVAMAGMGIVIGIGTVVYATLESMKVIDAIYFTVVTSTTLGFGDYCPESDWGKVFTLGFVPVSVVAVAGAIEHVAAVPLNNHKSKLESYVLAQFGDTLTQGDLDDIRRSSGLKKEDGVRANDFLLAMLIRLGYVNPDDTKKILALFGKLDANQSGEITDEDVGGASKSNGNGKKKKQPAPQKRPQAEPPREMSNWDDDAPPPPPPPPPPEAPQRVEQVANPVAAADTGGKGKKGKKDKKGKKGKKRDPEPEPPPPPPPVKRSGMALGEPTGVVKVGKDGKTRRKVKVKARDGGDEV